MKLSIRRFENTDADALYKLLSDEEVMRYIEPPYTRDKADSFLKKAGLSNSPLIYAVDDESGAFIGYVIYHDYEEGSKEIGWVIKKEVWRQGYAQALTSLLIDRAFSEEKTVVIECIPEQHVSKHIAKKYDFSYIGRRDSCDIYQLEYSKMKE